MSNEADFKSEHGVRFFIFSPIVKDRKGEFSALFENLRKQGIVRARIDGDIRELGADFQLIKTNKHSVDGLVSRQILNSKKIIKTVC